jgi:hypothetical protein
MLALCIFMTCVENFTVLLRHDTHPSSSLHQDGPGFMEAMADILGSLKAEQTYVVIPPSRPQDKCPRAPVSAYLS